MMKVIDVHSQEQKLINSNEIVLSKKRTTDYILSIPHSGKLILSEYAHKLNIDKHVLIGTDMHSDKIYDTNKGILLITQLNPYLVNMSRFRDGNDDPSLPIHLQRDSLHELSLEGKDILKQEYDASEKEKILSYYDKYHLLLKNSIEEMKKEHGFALLFDCHSMNSKGLGITPDKGEERPDFAIGTLDDTSADKEIINFFHETLKKEAEKHGLTVKKNHPYKGGFITRQYGKPEDNVHVIQLEIKKTNYMNDGLETESDFSLNSQGLQKINKIISTVFELTSAKAKQKWT